MFHTKYERQMDQDELYEIKITRKSNKYLFIKKTFKFLVPVSLVSIFFSYASGFSFFFTFNFHFSALVFPLLTHALERKYMFLICNGILAFLVKTLNLKSSSLSVSDFNDHGESMKSTTEASEKPVQASTVEDVVLAVEKEDKLVKPQGKGYDEELNVSFTSEIDEGRPAEGLNNIDNEDLDATEVEEEFEEGGMEDDGGQLGASAAEEVGVNINTEELNKKFEEFIRKMKEEIRIQAQQPQLVTV